jgi:serine/threonine-protein kinase
VIGGDATPATPTPLPGEPTATPVPELPMPSLINMDADQARAAIAELGLFAREDPPRSSDVISAGLVLDQFPRAGELISVTSTITFAVSLGPETAEVPNVVGNRVINAKIILEQTGFRVLVIEEASTTVDEGFVIRTEPSAGVRPARGETIRVVYSIGNKTTMPDVTGLPIEEARRQIEAAGLVISFEDLQTCDRLPADVCAGSVPGQVVSSIPRGGERVERGSAVTLGVRAP